MLLRRILLLVAFALLTVAVPAQDVAGSWQSTTEVWGRTVLRITKSDSGTLKGGMGYSTL